MNAAVRDANKAQKIVSHMEALAKQFAARGQHREAQEIRAAVNVACEEAKW